MLKDNVIADSDLHVMEPADLWQRYIAPEYQHAAPVGLTELTRDMRVRVKNHTMLRLGAVRPQRIDGRKTGWRDEHESVYADAEAHDWDAASTVRAMDVEGLDLAVMFPSRGLFGLGLDSAEHIGQDGLELVEQRLEQLHLDRLQPQPQPPVLAGDLHDGCSSVAHNP